MSSSINSIGYQYPIPTIGSSVLGTEEIVNDTAIGSIADAYRNLFEQPTGTYVVIQNNLCTELSNILKLLGSNKRYTNLPLDVSVIFDENELVDPNCKETLNAYKYYLHEILTGINEINACITSAQKALQSLDNLTGSTRQINNQAHVLITHLESTDQLIQEGIKKFSSYSVVKNVTMTNIVIQQKEGEDNMSQDVASQKTGKHIETSYKNLASGYKSALEDTYDSLDDLRNIKTEKQTCKREITDFYYLKGDDETYTPTDKYNPNAQVSITQKDTLLTSETSPIELFDELTLLDKLKYIVVYHKTQGDHYFFPDDYNSGTPCVINQVSTTVTEETQEIGNVELFYIGYLIDRDGPANALATFMEIKATAIRQQIQLLSYQLQAINMYFKLINRGFELFNQSQATGREKIPVASYMILRYVGANTARTLFRLADTQSRFIKDAQGNVIDSNTYLVLQYQSNNIKTSDTHFTTTNNYLLIKATDEGVNTFLKMIDDIGRTNIDNIFKDPSSQSSETEYHISREPFSSEEQTAIDAYKQQFGNSQYFYRLTTTSAVNKNGVVLDNLYQTVEDEELYRQFSFGIKIVTEKTVLIASSRAITSVKGVTTNGAGEITKIRASSILSEVPVTQIPNYAVETTNQTTLNNKVWNDTSGNSLILHLESDEDAKKYLPKELGVVPVDVSTAVASDYKSGVAWNDLDVNEDNVSIDNVWPQLINVWQSMYQTVQENYQSQQKAVTQSLSSLQKKLDTFNSTSVNFRSKAYTIFNKIVNLLS